MIPDNAEWQMTGQNEWSFGVKVRGIARSPLAEVWYDADSNCPEGAWRWFLAAEVKEIAWYCGRPAAGNAGSLIDAIGEAERAMGIYAD